ncbi:MAG TPA: PAS domain-containing protein [Chitinophagaceae bacterium]|jgi:two-component system sensor histidine kinase UhpB|nr:PAS domain-containing protein [Chitinophagaceae bacterium]
MENIVKILILEHDASDVELLQYELKKNSFEYTSQVVEDREGFEHALLYFNPEIILSDYSLPSFDAVAAFNIKQKILPDVPFIIVSGTIGEENAVELIRSGVTDYVLKDKLFTINPKIKRALNESREHHEKIAAERRLRISMERYNILSQATNDAIWDWDLDSNEVYWNEGLKKIFGYADQQIGKYADWWYQHIHPEDKMRVTGKIQYHLDQRITHWQDEYQYRCADGSYKYVYNRGYILLDDSKKPYRMIGTMMDLTEKKILENTLAEERIRHQKLMTQATIDGQEKEREELGKELHDNINQMLATVKMFLSIAKDDEKIREKLIQKSFNNVSEAIEEIRKLSKSLVPPSLGDIGLVDALREMVEEINVTNKINVRLNYEDYKEHNANKKMELMIYRVVQEQMNNILKYAKASIASVTLRKHAKNIFLSIADNGVGFDPSQRAKGIGLKNISSRVEFFCGNLNIISAPGKGCTLEINIPL